MIVALCVSCPADRRSFVQIPWEEREIVLMRAAPSAGVKGEWKRVLASEKFQMTRLCLIQGYGSTEENGVC